MILYDVEGVRFLMFKPRYVAKRCSVFCFNSLIGAGMIIGFRSLIVRFFNKSNTDNYFFLICIFKEHFNYDIPLTTVFWSSCMFWPYWHAMDVGRHNFWMGKNPSFCRTWKKYLEILNKSALYTAVVSNQQISAKNWNNYWNKHEKSEIFQSNAANAAL